YYRSPVERKVPQNPMPLLALLLLGGVLAVAMSQTSAPAATNPAAPVTDPASVVNAKVVLSQLAMSSYQPSSTPPSSDPKEPGFVAALAGYQNAMNLAGVALSN